jgi:hypothetical protein
MRPALATRRRGLFSKIMGLLFGVNTAWVRTYAGAYQFANVMYNSDYWTPWGGTTPISIVQDQGVVSSMTGADSTTVLRCYVSDQGVGLPLGTYTILNPSGLNVATGAYNGPGNYSAYSTATVQTFTLSAGNSGLYVFVMGAAGPTNASGNLAIILPGCLTSWQSGNVWNPQYLTYLSTLGVKQVRFMDAANTNGTLEADWADRVVPTKISLNKAAVGYPGYNAIPWEFMIDFANRTGITPWVNVPPRATLAYKQSMAALFAAGMTKPLDLEGIGNETWNTASAFSDSSSWLTYLTFTKYMAAPVTATDTLTYTAHGLNNGDYVVSHLTKENRAAGIPDANFLISKGIELPVTVIDANTFQLRNPYLNFTGSITSNVLTITAITGNVTLNDACLCGIANTIVPGRKILSQISGTTLGIGTYNVTAGADVAAGAMTQAVRIVPAQVNYLYNKRVESGKTANNDGNSGAAALESWTAFQTAYASAGNNNKIVNILGSQASRVDATTQRYAAAGVAAAVSEVCVAPYVNGLWWVAELIVASGTVQPGVWTSQGQNVLVCQYLATATPTPYQVANGIGAVATQTITTGGNGDGAYNLGTAFTASSSTAYVYYFVAYDINGTAIGATIPWFLTSASVTASAASTVKLTDTTANQAQRARYNTISGAGVLPQHKAAAPNASVCVYESGYDFSSAVGIADEHAFTMNFMTTADAAAALLHHFYTLAYNGATRANQYADDLGNDSVYSLTPAGYTDTTSARYAAIAAKGGLFRKKGLLTTLLPNVVAPPITTAPMYPYTVQALPAGYTYTIVGGDNYSDFTVSGSNIVMTKGTGYSFTIPTAVTLVLEGSDGFSSTLFSLRVVLGSAWFDSAAQFVFDSTTDTDTAALNPPAGYGLTLAKTSTATAVASAGLWAMTSAVYQADSMSAVLDMTKPLLVAYLFDPALQARGYSTLVQLGQSPSIGFYAYPIGSGVGFQCYMGSGQAINNDVLITIPDASFTNGAKHVHWAFFDPVAGAVTTGYDQTTNMVTTVAVPATTVGTTVTVGANPGSTVGNSVMNHGSMQVLNKAGLVLGSATTPGSALQLVKAMQTLHGI